MSKVQAIRIATRSRAARRLRPLLLSLATLLIHGCAINDHFDDQVIGIDRSIDAARNALLLTNVLRASASFPLTFITVPTVHGSNMIGGSLGLPTITIGPDQTAAQRQVVFGPNSTSASNTLSFDVAVLASQDFYRSLLTPLSIATMHFFIEQGYPRDILFPLVLDRVLIGSGATLSELRNDPRSPSFARFVAAVRMALDRGLTTEIFQPAGMARLCFDPTLASIPLAGAKPLCGSRETLGLSFGDHDAMRPPEIELVTRSSQGMFYYVGHFVDAPEGDQLRVPDRTGATAGDLFFRVDTGGGRPCFTEADFGGRHYCIPSEARNAARVIGLLAELVALNTSINQLPLTTTVRITP